MHSESIAFKVAGVLSEKNIRIIDHSMVYQLVKNEVSDEDIIEEVYNATILLLEDKYGILFDIDMKVDL